MKRKIIERCVTMQKRASSKLSLGDVVSFLLVTVLTISVIIIFSAFSRASALNNAVAEREAAEPEETSQTEMTAVIPKDNRAVAVGTVLAVSALLLSAVIVFISLRWFKTKKTAAGKRKYNPRTEVTFKNISRRELGKRKRIAYKGF